MSNVVTLNGGANMTEKMKKLQNAVSELKGLKEERSQLNADIQAIRERFAALGVPKAAADMAIRYSEWDVEKRQGFDVAYALMREVIGLPVQGDLFKAASSLAADVEERKEAAKPTAKEIADRQFEQATRNGKMKDAPAPAKKTEAGSNPPAPPAPNAAGIAEAMKKEDQANG